jgi:hypothetical protein
VGVRECGTPGGKFVQERCERVSFRARRCDDNFEVFGALRRLLATDQALDRVKHRFLGAHYLGLGGALASEESEE